MNSFFKSVLHQQKLKKTFLCVGLDPHLDLLPLEIRGDKSQVFNFLKTIVDVTHHYACCFKPQIAYFSAFGLEDTLEKIIAYIHSTTQLPVILDAKRNDIGSTAEMYAQEAFKRYMADGITVSPYMGGDTITPFTNYKEKGVFVLCRTSNKGAGELQNLTTSDGEPFYQVVARQAMFDWNSHQNIGLVLGATALDELRKMRNKMPEAWFLVPGVGAQGGDLESVIEYGQRVDGESGIIINSARAILYASENQDWAQASQNMAQWNQKIMSRFFKN